MAITVVSTLPTPTPPTATESGSDVAVAGQDFANLLLGQLNTNAGQTVISAQTVIAAQTVAAAQTDLPITGAASADAASLLAALGLATTPTDAKSASATPASATPSETSPDDTAPVDAAASVLAALGLATTPAITLAQEPGKSDQNTGEPLTAISGSVGQGLKTESLVAEPALPPTTVTAEQAAKFAATLATTVQSVGTKTDSPEATADGISPSPSNVAGNAVAHPTERSASLSVHTPVRDQNWTADFGQKIVWLASNDKQSAQLTLNPPQMGPIEISLNVDKGSASVSFASANAEVRDAIETALPRLREMFASAGIELGQTNVGAGSFSQQQAGSDERSQSSSRWMSDNAILAADTAGALQAKGFAARQGNGMVDIFA